MAYSKKIMSIKEADKLFPGLRELSSYCPRKPMPKKLDSRGRDTLHNQYGVKNENVSRSNVEKPRALGKMWSKDKTEGRKKLAERGMHENFIKAREESIKTAVRSNTTGRFERKPDNEVNKQALYMRAYREKRRNGVQR